MIDYLLLGGKFLLIALLYVFLAAAIRTGVGRAKGSSAIALVLTVIAGPQGVQGKRYPLTKPLVIGRAQDCDVVIPSDFVSSRHARVVPTDSGAVVEDLDSRNGTSVDERAISRPTATKAGSVIGIGQIRLRLDRS